VVGSSPLLSFEFGVLGLLRFVVPGIGFSDIIQLVDKLLCLHVVRNHRSRAHCTLVSFETEMSGSLTFVLSVMWVLGFMLHTSALGSLRHVGFGFLLPMLFGMVALGCRRLCVVRCQVWALLMFFREVGLGLIPSTSGGWR